MKALNQFIIEKETDNVESLDGNIRIELVNKLQVALAEEFNQWYMYTIVRPFLAQIEKDDLVKIYDVQAQDELKDHAFWLMDRIMKLGGTPDRVISPDLWDATADHKYIRPELSFDLLSNINQNIQSEEGAIETYNELITYTEDKDKVTCDKMKHILKDEQEHLKKLLDYKAKLEKQMQ